MQTPDDITFKDAINVDYLTAQITNSSLIEFGDLLASFSASYARIGVRGSITEMHTLEGTHTVGETTINLE